MIIIIIIMFHPAIRSKGGSTIIYNIEGIILIFRRFYFFRRLFFYSLLLIP